MELGGQVWEAYLSELRAFLLRLVVFLKNVTTITIEVDDAEVFRVGKECHPSFPVAVPKAWSTSRNGLLVCQGSTAKYNDLVITATTTTATTQVEQKAQYQLLESVANIKVR